MTNEQKQPKNTQKQVTQATNKTQTTKGQGTIQNQAKPRKSHENKENKQMSK